MRVLTVIGARPQFVKAAVVSKAFIDAGIDEILVHTGQHYDAMMSDVFFNELGIPNPSYNLDIGSADHGAQTGRMLEQVEAVMLKENSDRVLVYGDTNSTLAGALAAAKLHIPVDHIEAGLRSFNRRMPEEVNRVITDHLSALLFAPTDTAIHNLAKEGIDGPSVIRCGDVMFDATLAAVEIAKSKSNILQDLELQTGNYILTTIHRAENTDDPELLEALVKALAKVAQEHTVVLPLHPRTRNALDKHGLLDDVESALCTCAPLGYLDMTQLEAGARTIATDSGGVQKEAFFHRVPCVTLRTETEWVELIDAGWNTICPAGTENMAEVILQATPPKDTTANPYGDGNAARVIAETILATQSAPAQQC